MAFSKTDESLVSSNLHYYVRKLLQLLSLLSMNKYIVCRDSLVGIATGDGLDDQGEREFESR
jgi:two-component SAPR family response regulator